MGRTATEVKVAPEVPAIGKKFEAAVIEAQNTSLSHADADAILAAGVDIGRIQALDFMATIANTTAIAIYENVKKSKTYRFIVNPESATHRHFESFDDFCRVKLGKSDKRMRELVANRNLIGQDAFEQAEKMGLRQVDYNAIKALPQPDQELIRQAVEESSSRDEVLGLLQELAAKHAREKQELSVKVATLEKTVIAKEQSLEAKDKHNKEIFGKYNAEREKVIAFETNRKPLTPIEHRDYEATEIQDIKNRILVDMARLEKEVSRLTHGDDTFETTDLLREEAAQVVTLLMQRLQSINSAQFLYIDLETVMGGLGDLEPDAE